MRKIINSTYITLDGVIAQPHLWPKLIAPSDARAGAIQTELLLACDAVLMGRRTYEGFAPVWPTRSGDPYSDRINTIPKYVVSTTLQNPHWANTTVIARDAATEIRKLKAASGQDIVQYGFGSVSKLLLEQGLLDEIRLWVYPQTIGKAKLADLMAADAIQAQFHLADSTALSNGIVVLRYSLVR